MHPLRFHDKKHLARMFVQEQRINAIFNMLVREIAPEMRKWKEHSNSSVWVRNASIERAIERKLINFKLALEKEIKENQSAAWKESILKNNKFVEQYIKGMAITQVAKQGLFSRNLDALKALQNRVENGFTLSDRVWQITEQTKGHIELFLESGLATGRNAEEIGRDFRQLLQNPDKRFRRIRDKSGKLVPSAPMKAYHPGSGIYRSARMNALRVSATETNMGYRMSDAVRWKQLDFILGFEVKRSQNAHPCKICDVLVGKYPKDFIFVGWHPFCICFAVPIVMDHDDFADYLLHDTVAVDKYIQYLPSSANKFFGENPGYVNNSYAGKLNADFFSGKRFNIPSIKERLMLSQKPVEKNTYLSFDPFSPIIIEKLKKLENDTQRQTFLRSIIDDDVFKPLFINYQNGAKTVMHPLHKGPYSKRWKETKQMAKDLNAKGIDVCFLPEYNNDKSIDAITLFKGKYVIADFKYSNSAKIGTLKKDLIKGFKQADYIVLKLDRGDLSTLQNAFEELKRKNKKIGNIKVINKYGKSIDIEVKNIRDSKYIKKLKGFF